MANAKREKYLYDPCRQVSYRKIKITGGFWKKWQDAAAECTIETVRNQLALNGRFDALKHDWRSGEPNKPHIFFDSDVAKWIEGAAYSLFFRPDAAVEAQIEETIDMIEAGISTEGYFNSYYQAIEPHERWTRRENHELYCAGHLIEAAIAYYDATGKRRFLDLMLRYAEYIRVTFAIDASAAFATPGHEEIELALIRLWQCEGDKKWLDLALHFIRKRGTDPAEQCFNKWFSSDYAQDQAPVAGQETAEGHVVRFGYLFSAVADAARETRDEALLEACRRVWRDVVDRKMYVTGGVGNMKHGEAFGPAYFLPNYEAYTETCASIAMAFFGRRLSLIDPKGEYADICELQLYNGALAGISLDGGKFFYENPLSMRPSDQRFFNERRASGRPVQRVEYFSCSCCPPNILRMLTAIGDWIYGVRDGGSSGGDECPIIFVHQYVQSEAEIEVKTIEGETVKLMLTQKTKYPWDGRIEFKINAPKSFYATIALRIPEWSSTKATLSMKQPTGQSVATDAARSPVSHDGYMRITKEWGDNETFTLNIPMEITEIEANPYVSQNAGRIALRRGPLIYCVEGADNGDCLEDLLIMADVEYNAVWDDDLLGGVYKIKFDALSRRKFEGLYRKWSPRYDLVEAFAIPYYAWGNRDEGEMAVWLRKQP